MHEKYTLKYVFINGKKHLFQTVFIKSRKVVILRKKSYVRNATCTCSPPFPHTAAFYLVTLFTCIKRAEPHSSKYCFCVKVMHYVKYTVMFLKW